MDPERNQPKINRSLFLLVYLATLAGDVLWVFASRPIFLIIFALFASAPLSLLLLLKAMSLLFCYTLCSLASSALGSQLFRLRQCRLSLNRLRGRLAEFVVTNKANALFEKFTADFTPKEGAKRHFLDYDFGPNVIFICPKQSNKYDRLRPPQAYPNFMEESVVIASIRTADLKKDPFLLFLLYHEIEHCTIDAFKLEAKPYEIFTLTLVTAVAFVLGAHSDAFAILCCFAYLVLLNIEAWILLPGQLEARTDLRALARLDDRDFEHVIKIRRREYRERLAKRNGPFFRRWFRRGTLAIYVQARTLETALHMRGFAKMIGTSFKPQQLKGLGNLSLYGDKLAFPAITLMYIAATMTSQVAWSTSVVYLLASLLIFFASGVIGVKAESLRLERKSLLDQMERD